MAHRGQRRGLRDAPALPSGEAPARPPSHATVFLLRPADFAHPAIRAQVEARAEAAGGPWAVVPPGSWQGKHFPTAKAARDALRAAGFKGPVGKGTSSRWSR